MGIEEVGDLPDEARKLRLILDVADRQADAALILKTRCAPGRGPDVQCVRLQEACEIPPCVEGGVGQTKGRQPIHHFRGNSVEACLEGTVEVEVAHQPEILVLLLAGPDKALGVPGQVEDAEGGEMDNAAALHVVPTPGGL